MGANDKALVAIPARMAASRLPGKPLADIAGEPMIVHVWRRAMEAEIGPVIVACAEPEIADAIKAAGGEAVLTDPGHGSGSDRVHEAVQSFDPAGEYGIIVNLQGDLPTMDPADIRLTVELLDDPDVDISTLAAVITEEYERNAPSVVKAVVSMPPGHLEVREKLEQLRALENGMRIDVGVVAEVPFGVDTPDDLDRARKRLG